MRIGYNKKMESIENYTVKVISRTGDSAIIETVLKGMPERKVIAFDKIVDDTVSVSDYESAAPYGVPLAQILEKKGLAIVPNALQRACRDRGLWTASDFERKPRSVQEAIQEALQLDAGAIIALAQDFDDYGE